MRSSILRLSMFFTACLTVTALADDKTSSSTEAARKQFKDVLESEKGKVISAFDQLMALADKAKNVNAADRATIILDLKDAKSAFQSAGKLTPIMAMQSTYGAFIFNIRKAFYGKLLPIYDKAIKALPASNTQRTVLQKELKSMLEEINSLDALQVGRIWEGYRSDLKPPAQLKFDPFACRRFRIQVVQPAAGTAECTFKVTKRQGTSIVGEISQNKGAAIWEVDGTFDGINLKLVYRKMLKGEERFFNYQGQVIGNLGFLKMWGRKTDKSYTEGNILLEIKD